MWLAETLGEGFPFVRVDLYEIDGHPYVGELTFTPSAGFHTLDPDQIDFDLGKLWRKRRHERFPATPPPAPHGRSDVSSDEGALTSTGASPTRLPRGGEYSLADASSSRQDLSRPGAPTSR